MAKMQRNNIFMRENIDLIEKERSQLAHELHDEIGQNLTAIRTSAQLICRQSEGRKSLPVAQGIISMTDQMFEVIHHILDRLRPSVLDKLGLKDAIQDIVFSKQEHMGLMCTSKLKGDFTVLNMGLQLAIYRVIQESLTNAVRHGKASQASIDLHVNDDELKLRIINNGSPLDAEQDALMQRKTSGIGLLGICHRVQAWGGEMRLENTDDGVQLVCSIPLAT